MPLSVGRPKGTPKTGGRIVGSKNKLVLKREELRQIFNEKMMEKWDMLLKVQIKDAKKDYRSRHYIFDQVIGKPIQPLDISGKPDFLFDDTDKPTT